MTLLQALLIALFGYLSSASWAVGILWGVRWFPV